MSEFDDDVSFGPPKVDEPEEIATLAGVAELLAASSAFHDIVAILDHADPEGDADATVTELMAVVAASRRLGWFRHTLELKRFLAQSLRRVPADSALRRPSRRQDDLRDG